MKIGTRGKVILVFVGLLMLVGAWQAISYWFKYGYSKGERTGVLRKLSITGSPVCKFVDGQLVLAGSLLTNNQQEPWRFTIDGVGEDLPLYKKLEEAMRADKTVTLKYRHDKPIWWRCTPHEYYVTDVILSP
jgi:hypothetical protein